MPGNVAAAQLLKVLRQRSKTWHGLMRRNTSNYLEAELASLPFSTPPEDFRDYEVGDVVEVFCDHDNEDEERVRGWLEGVVVQVDPKMVAVQFHENVYLTDGWMVPDHVLWCPKESSNMRRRRKKKKN